MIEIIVEVGDLNRPCEPTAGFAGFVVALLAVGQGIRAVLAERVREPSLCSRS